MKRRFMQVMLCVSTVVCLCGCAGIVGNLPGIEGELPEIEEEVAGIEGELPEKEREVSEIREEVPGIEGELPKTEREVPEIAGELPEYTEAEKSGAFPGVTDNWPENIVLKDRGMTAWPLLVDFTVEEQMKVSLICTTTGGELHVKIMDEEQENVYFDEEDPRGTYEVSIDEAGICYLAVYARDHRGSVCVEPVKGEGQKEK